MEAAVDRLRERCSEAPGGGDAFHSRVLRVLDAAVEELRAQMGPEARATPGLVLAMLLPLLESSGPGRVAEVRGGLWGAAWGCG
jgi:hypothetical protein